MRTLVMAIITGFGLKLGSDIYKYVKKQAGFLGDDKDGEESIDQAAGGAQTA